MASTKGYLAAWLPSRFRQPQQPGKVSCAFLDVEDGDWISLTVDYSEEPVGEERKAVSGKGRGAVSWLMRILRSSADILLASDIFENGVEGAGFSREIPYTQMRVDKKAVAVGSFKTIHKGRLRGKGAVEDVAVVFARREGGKMLREEGKVMEALGQHPHLCQLLGVSQHPITGDFVLVMELAALGSLERVLSEYFEERKVPAWCVLLTAAMQVCDGMVQLAEHKFVHRDLAARNVLVFSFDLQDRAKVRVKICDYGLAASIRGQCDAPVHDDFVKVRAEDPCSSRSSDEACDAAEGIEMAPARAHEHGDAHTNSFEAHDGSSSPTDIVVTCAENVRHPAPSCPRRLPGVAPSEIPWRFLAPEVIASREWSERSDVWAFGVLMWEIWSPCLIPYAEEDDDEQVAVLIRAGLRLNCPKGCPLAVFAVMQRCWASEAFARPNFLALRRILDDSHAATSAMPDAAS